jgi:hypothetical protein
MTSPKKKQDGSFGRVLDQIRFKPPPTEPNIKVETEPFFLKFSKFPKKRIFRFDYM